MASADEIGAFAKRRYVEPAFEAGEHMLTLRAGDVHTDMRLTSRVPAVCSALKSKKFQAMCGIQLRKRTGPEQGPNTRLTYCLPSSRSGSAPNADALKVSAASEGSSAGPAVEFHRLSESCSSAATPVSNEATSDSNAKGSKETRSVSLNELGEMRRHLVDLMNDTEGRPPSLEGPSQRLARLKRDGHDSANCRAVHVYDHRSSKRGRMGSQWIDPGSKCGGSRGVGCREGMGSIFWLRSLKETRG